MNHPESVPLSRPILPKISEERGISETELQDIIDTTGPTITQQPQVISNINQPYISGQARPLGMMRTEGVPSTSYAQTSTVSPTQILTRTRPVETITTREPISTTYTGSVPMSRTEEVTERVEREFRESLPGSTIHTGTVPISSNVIGTTLPTNTVPITSTNVPITTTGIPITSTVGTQNIQYEHVQAPITTTSQLYTGPTYVEGVASITPIRQEEVTGVPFEESQYMRDSTMMKRADEATSETRWEAQQASVNSLRYENHQSFENWEANRNLFVNHRMNIIDDLIAGLDKNLTWLDVGVDKVILFFKEREAQELEYSKRVKHGLTQVGEHFGKSGHPEVMGDFSQGLKENDAFHATQKRNSEVLSMFIKKDILDWILLPSEKNYKEQATALRGTLATYRKKMDSLASKRLRAYNKYMKLYDTILKKGKPTTKEENLFKRQLKYSLGAREELRMLRVYNEQALNVIEEFAKLSSSRLAEVQKAFSLYLQKYSELYKNNAVTPDHILELINKSSGPHDIRNLFTVKNLVSPANYDFLAKTLGMYYKDLTLTDLNPFLVNFPESVDPAHSSFVLKEWEATKQGNLLKKPRACNVIATKDNNLLIIEKKHEDMEIGRIKDPMQMRYTTVQEIGMTEDGTVMQVVERVPGTLYTHTSRAKLKFETPEEAQQFAQFVNSQTSGEV